MGPGDRRDPGMCIRTQIGVYENQGEIAAVHPRPDKGSKTSLVRMGRAAVDQPTVWPRVAGTTERPGPRRRHGVVPIVEVNDVDIDAIACGSVVNFVPVGYSGDEVVGSFEQFKVVAAVREEVIGIGSVLARDDVLGVALARVLPAVIFRLRQSNDGIAAKGVERRSQT